MNNNIEIKEIEIIEKEIEIEIEYPETAAHLVEILTQNDYIVQAEPVYQTLDEVKKDYPRSYRGRPRIKHYSIKIVGKIDKPDYEEKE
jgi:hypothetical protein